MNFCIYRQTKNLVKVFKIIKLYETNIYKPNF